MKKQATQFAVIIALLSGAPAAFAKGKKDDSVGATGATYGMARFDVNQNGILDEDEIVNLKKAFAEGDPAAKMLDTNNNGVLEDSEIAAVKLPPAESDKKKKKKKE